MRKNPRPNFILIFILVTSVFGTLTALLISIQPRANPSDFACRKQLVGLAFAGICVGGISAAFFPARCLAGSAFHVAVESQNEEQKHGSSVLIRGHHPDCGKFSAHTVLYGGTCHCAACTGLFMGALMALFITVLYFFLNVSFVGISVSAAIAGQLGLALGFLQFKLRGWARLAANTVFVFGGSLILVVGDQQAASWPIDLYLICLVVLWILTRIMISQWDNSKICFECGYICASNRKKRELSPSAYPVESACHD